MSKGDGDTLLIVFAILFLTLVFVVFLLVFTTIDVAEDEREEILFQYQRQEDTLFLLNLLRTPVTFQEYNGTFMELIQYSIYHDDYVAVTTFLETVFQEFPDCCWAFSIQDDEITYFQITSGCSPDDYVSTSFSFSLDQRHVDVVLHLAHTVNVQGGYRFDSCSI